MSILPTAPPDIGKVLEPLLLGHLLNWTLFGGLSIQVYVYYLAFPTDSLQSKTLVYAVYATELVQSILLAKKFYQEFAAGFGNYEAVDAIGLLWFAVPIMNSIVAAVVQMFYAYRIKMLTESYVIPIVVVFLALVGLGGGIALGVVAKGFNLFSLFFSTPSAVEKTLVATGVWNAGSALCDVVIATSMIYYLSRRRTVWKPTQRIVQRLTRLILETGAFTATLAIVNFILYLIPGHPTYFQTTSTVLGKLYSNTMMVVLNSRISISRNDTPSSEFQLSSIMSTRQPVFGISDISVTHERWTDLEDYNTTIKELEHSDSQTAIGQTLVLKDSTGNNGSLTNLAT